MQISAASSRSIHENHVKIAQQHVSQRTQQGLQSQSQNHFDPDHDGDIDSHLGRDIDYRA